MNTFVSSGAATPVPVNSAYFSADGARFVTASGDRTARVWDVTWAAKLADDALVRAVARARLVGEGRLTGQELRLLRPLLGEVDADVVSRWLAPSTDDAEIEAILARWRSHREMALALAREVWAARAAEINAGLAKAHAEQRGGKTGQSGSGPP